MKEVAERAREENSVEPNETNMNRAGEADGSIGEFIAVFPDIVCACAARRQELATLKGMAQHAGLFANLYRKMEVLAKVDSHLRVLDLKAASTRAAISQATCLHALFESSDASGSRA